MTNREPKSKPRDFASIYALVEEAIKRSKNVVV